jgi:hypothetical protein
MFDHAVVEEGLGQAVKSERRYGIRGTPDGLGASPDGLGAYIRPEMDDPNYPYPEPTASSPNPPPVAYGPEYDSVNGRVEFLEPDDTSAGAATRSAGFTLLFVALSTGVGYALKGGLGASAGLLLSAGLSNGYRAQKWWDTSDPSEKHEAIVSSVFAVGEVFAGGYVAYKAYQLGDRRK